MEVIVRSNYSNSIIKFKIISICRALEWWKREKSNNSKNSCKIIAVKDMLGGLVVFYLIVEEVGVL